MVVASLERCCLLALAYWLLAGLSFLLQLAIIYLMHDGILDLGSWISDSHKDPRARGPVGTLHTESFTLRMKNEDEDL